MGSRNSTQSKRYGRICRNSFLIGICFGGLTVYFLLFIFRCIYFLHTNKFPSKSVPTVCGKINYFPIWSHYHAKTSAIDVHQNVVSKDAVDDHEQT